MIKKFLGLIIVIGALGFTGWAVLNRQYVKDLYIVQTTDVQPQAKQLGEKLAFTSSGAFLYDASQPMVLEAEPFNESCGDVSKEKTIVLGCYTLQRVYVYNVTDPRLEGVQEVTAAHELLHAVYERLSIQEREEIDIQLQQAANAINDERFQATIEAYRQLDPSVVPNELHSILGTEVSVLPEALELHYQKYFKNRAQIVAFSQKYQSQFIANEQKIKSLDASMATLKTDIASLESSLAALETQLNQSQTELARLRSTDVAAFNAAVPGFNALVARYNSQVKRVQELVTRYNNLLDERSAVIGAQSDLNKQLDSSFKSR